MQEAKKTSLLVVILIFRNLKFEVASSKLT